MGNEVLGNLLRDIGSPLIGLIVKNVLPGTAGDVGSTLASNIIVGLGEALGASDPTSPEEVEKAIRADPEKAAQVAKKIEAENAPAILNELELRVQAQTNARETTVELVKQKSIIAYAPTIYSFSIVVSFNAVLFWLLFAPVHISDTAGGILTMLLGVLTREMAAVGGYFLGSTQSSKDKDATIANAMSQAAAPAGRAVGAVIANAVKK